MKKIMGVDYGDARTGIAISDLLCSIVGSTTVIHSRRDEKTTAEIKYLIPDNIIGEFVVGLPMNLDGAEGPRAEVCRAFAEQLKEASIKAADAGYATTCEELAAPLLEKVGSC